MSDPRFEELLREQGLLDLDRLMTHDGYFTEPSLFNTYAQVSFLDDLPLDERNRALVRAAVEHLGTILDHARKFYAGRTLDFFCAVTVTGWEYLDEGDPLMPRFWIANPSRGAFDHVRLAPPSWDESAMVAGWLDHDPAYLLNDDIVGSRLERVFVQRQDFQLPPVVRGEA
ncbi:Imm15 family immunity protein [Amycolatopsis sp. cg5]|uniref:Imm15 family immunity protein n=1 Tax=Amycolatopsis sp. cg5 TaxID=3238802 RepID=UPI0035260261